MEVLNALQNWTAGLHLSPLMTVGIMTFAGFYVGKSMKFLKLPSIIGFMVIGVLLGPSLFNLLNEHLQIDLSFITEIALSFVAVSIGLELSFSALKKQGPGIIWVIITESLLAFITVTTVIYLVTGDLPLALIFGAIAPASAPAGTVAIIQEYKAKGPLTKALYAVVGFDDGLGIIIFGFASAIAKSILESAAGNGQAELGLLILEPLKEVVLSIGVGGVMALIFVFLARRLKNQRDIFILTFAMVLVTTGLCNALHLSIILTNMVVGIIVVNTQPHSLVQKIHEELTETMPLLFVMFFVLAGANLHIAALPALGVIGVVYVLGRSAGLVVGSKIGAAIGKMDANIRKYLGMGILSQAGVAIGLSLIVKHEFTGISGWGAEIGSTVITTVTATCIFFEIIGPILTKIALEKSGEITIKH